MSRYDKIILIPPCHTFGDCLSVIGLLYYLLNYYDKIFFFINDESGEVYNYYTEFFSNEPLYDSRIFLTTNALSLIEQSQYGEYHICNTFTGDWKDTNWTLYDASKIDRDCYFNDKNPIINKLPIQDSHQCTINSHLPNNTKEINHLFYYKLIGLNNNVRMDYFNYNRNYTIEAEMEDLILKKHGLNRGDKYNIINDPIGSGCNLASFIKNDYPVIDINYASPCVGYLLSLLEKAESIHFIEGSNVNFIYHCQYKNIFNYTKKIFFHVWLRNRNWDIDSINLDYAWKMMSEPTLKNWEFIF